MEIFQIVVAVAGGIVAIWGAIKAIIALVKWFRLWKILRLQEFKRLKAIEAEHDANERIRKFDNPISRDIQAQLERSYKPPEVELEFDPRFPSKNLK